MSKKKNKIDLSSIDFYKRLFFFTRIGNEAVRLAQIENKKHGIPNTYNLNGRLVFEMPDGSITTKSPWNS